MRAKHRKRGRANANTKANGLDFCLGPSLVIGVVVHQALFDLVDGEGRVKKSDGLRYAL